MERLTPREHDILRLVAEGLNNRQIAARLGLGYQTVRNKLPALYDKLQAHTRAGLVVTAWRAGLVEIDQED